LIQRHQEQTTKLPHRYIQPKFGAKVKYSTPDDDNPILPDDRIKYIQQVVGVFLYYGIYIYNTIIVSLSYIGEEQAVDTSNTTGRVYHILDYPLNCRYNFLPTNTVGEITG